MNFSRRSFMAVTALGGTGLVSGCATTTPRRVCSPNARLQHACVGVGGMGGVDLSHFLGNPDVQVVALCDVDRNILDAAAKQAPGARLYTDWREMLAAEGDRVDSVNVAVPDHMHAAIELPALRSGKHVYGQKPLAHDVTECRALARAARKAGVVTQLGTQAASGNGDRAAVRFLREGVIGRIKRVILFSNRPGAEGYRLAGPRPAQGSPAPGNLSWDLWLGTAPERSFSPGIYHPGIWRCWLDFGTGWSGDIGCHIFDAVWKGLGLTAPRTVKAEVQESWVASPERRADVWPQANHITWVFPGNALTAGADLMVEWMDGGYLPEGDLQELMKSGRIDAASYEGSLVLGTEGAMMLPNGSGPILLPHEKFAGVARPNPKGPDHYERFVIACRGGEMTESHFEQTGPMAEAILRGTVAARVPGTVLQWDARRMRIPNSDEAQRLLRRTYRPGWDVDLGV
ncbi:MAG: Gfo/Idh/MocA family oxidoreductase [Kiritimatiellia bacterium]